MRLLLLLLLLRNRHRCPTMALSRELIYDHTSR
jgi:hypothetical protein